MAFATFQEFRDHLAEQPDVLAAAFLTKILTFATGREMGFSDRAEIAAIVRATAAGGHRVRDLLRRAVGSEIFRSK
jgi:hypothetical protein